MRVPSSGTVLLTIVNGPFYTCYAVIICLTVTSRSSIEIDERIELVIGVGVCFHLSYIVLQGNSGILKNKGTYLRNFVSNSGLRKFSFVETCHRLSSRKVVTLRV